jgi:O-antigen/teichoic acid export membrane protein
MQLQVVAATIAFVIGAWLLSRARPQELAGVTAEYCTRSWLASVFPLAATAGMQLINHHTDIVMLGLFRSAEEVGVYRVSVVGASLVIFGLQIINMVVAPHFARLYSIGERDQLQRVVTASARIALFTALPAVLVFLLFGETLLQVVFGVEFARAYVPLTILAVGQLVNAGAGSVGYLLNMTGHERDTTRGVAIAAGMNVVLNVVLIPAFGMAGAAMATTASLVIWNVILWRAVRTRLGINSMAFNFFGIRSAT